MKKMTILLFLGVMSMVGAAVARNLVWKGTVGDSFATPSLWNIQDTPTFSETPPGPDDKIVISISRPITLDLSDDANLGIVNGCLGICLAESTSKCYIIAPEGCDKSISVPIVGAYNTLSGNLEKGMVFISGPGTVHLCATNMRSYATRTMDIYGGATVWLPQNNDLGLDAYKMGDVAVSNSATLYLPTRHNGSLNGGGNYVEMERLFGDGTITPTEYTQLRFANSGGVFSGILDANINLFSGGRQMLTGVSSTMSRAPRVYNAYRNLATGNGTLGVMKFGMSGQPSSIGTAGTFDADVRGATYLYLGNGEVTDKRFNLYGHNQGFNTLDAGTAGGLVFTNAGGFRAVGSGSANNCVICLSGSNTVPCVIQGQFNEDNTNYLVTVVKKGSGTWRFADPVAYGKVLSDYRAFHGSISVDEGVLQFDTIAPLGEYCSLGCATILKGPTLGAWANLPDVDWAFSLGGTNSTLTGLAEGTLEYTGTTTGLCEGRRVRLEADGRFRANGPKKIRYRMADTTSARAKTLSLDGESMATNEVRGVFDTAANPVSIVKEGGGTWLLGGKGPLHGDVKVKGGKLIVENYPLGSKYTWFKFTIKNLFDPVLQRNKSAVSVRFFGLYDANGICQTARTMCSEDMRAATIEPGEAGYATLRKFTKGGYSAATAPYHDHNPTNMFRTSPVYDAIPYNLSGTSSGYYPQIENERSWVPMVVRLTNGAPAIASYDWVNTYGFASGNKGGFHWMPNIWSLEGSVDGMQWEDLNPAGGDFSITTNDYPHVGNDSYFIYSGVGQSTANFTTRSANNAYYHTGGLAIRGTTTNNYVTLSSVRSVQVDGGATLEVNGDVTFTSLVVDASKGCGTIKGGCFPANGTVQLENYPAGGEVLSMPFNLSATTSPENISRWNVEIGGEARSRWHVRYADGKLTVYPPGMRVMFR